MSLRASHDLGESAAGAATYIPISRGEGDVDEDLESLEILLHQDWDEARPDGSISVILEKYLYEDEEGMGSDNENDVPSPQSIDVQYQDDLAEERGENEPETPELASLRWTDYTSYNVTATRGRVVNTPVDGAPEPTSEHGQYANIPEHCVTPLDFFQLFFDSAVMAKFVDSTNKYGRKMRKNWTDTNASELDALFAVMMYMGLVQQPSTSSFFATKYDFQRECFTQRRHIQ